MIATAGCVFPSCIIVLSLAVIYYRFRNLRIMQGILGALRPAVIAMIASAGISLLIMALYGQRTLPADPGSIDWIACLIFAAAFIIIRTFKLNPIHVMAGCGAAGILLYSFLA